VAIYRWESHYSHACILVEADSVGDARRVARESYPGYLKGKYQETCDHDGSIIEPYQQFENDLQREPKSRKVYFVEYE
jgi:protein-tyrosine phosphatase